MRSSAALVEQHRAGLGFEHERVLGLGVDADDRHHRRGQRVFLFLNELAGFAGGFALAASAVEDAGMPSNAATPRAAARC